jgi:hypothetical protein
MLAVAEFGSEDLVSWHNDAMFSVIGGIYLVGGGAPLSCPPEHLDSLRAGFFRRLGQPDLAADARNGEPLTLCPEQQAGSGPRPRAPHEPCSRPVGVLDWSLCRSRAWLN